MAVDVLREMQFFTPRYLLSDQPDAQCSDVKKLRTFYEMDETNVSSELAEFRSVFRKLNKVICVDDLLFDQRRNKRLNQKSESEVLVYRDDCVNGDEEDNDDDYQYVEPEVDAQTKVTWADQSFVKPFRAMQELSGFPSLNVIYNESHIQDTGITCNNQQQCRESDEQSSTHQEPFARNNVGRLVFFNDDTCF
jgi:hypothetical protein